MFSAGSGRSSARLRRALLLGFEWRRLPGADSPQNQRVLSVIENELRFVLIDPLHDRDRDILVREDEMDRPGSNIPLIDGVLSVGFQLVKHTLLKFVFTEEYSSRVELHWRRVRRFILSKNRP